MSAATRTRRWQAALVCVALTGGAASAHGCAASQVRPSQTAAGDLALSRVVLYRNGIGYFERSGATSGQSLRLKVRKDQVNDLLKSLAVVDRKSGKVLGVSIPLDPQSWHKLALSALTPGAGQLAQVLDGLRGTRVAAETKQRRVAGRIVMVERMQPLPDPQPRDGGDGERFEDHKLTLLDGEQLHVLRLSELQSLTIEDGDVVMQLDRHLDASAGEGMFQQVELTIRLSGDDDHDLTLSYVAPAPLWKPTYRIVLDEKSGKALLQAWAVVDNTSGESWDSVELSLTSGAPIAFRYDLHTPREVERPDLSYSAADKRAEVALGERSFSTPDAAAAQAPAPAPAPPAAPQYEREEEVDADGMRELGAEGYGAGGGGKADLRKSKGRAARPESAAAPTMAPPSPSITMDALRQSAAAQARAQQVAGLTRFDLPDRVTLPDGSATMVALINQPVQGEQVFVYRPGGSGQGYELNPYRVVRFKNDTDFVLEPGPIAIYAQGSFVGEGLSEAIGSREVATIPFAVEPSLVVRSRIEGTQQEVRQVSLARGVLMVDSWERTTTVWTVSGDQAKAERKVLIRHPRQGGNYELVEPKSGVEKLTDAYFVPLALAPGAREVSIKVVEQTPTRSELSLWDANAVEFLDTMLTSTNLDQATRAKLEPIVQKRREMGRIDTEIEGKQSQQAELDERVEQTRESLRAIQRDARAGALRKKLGERLDEFLKQADALGRALVELQSKRLELKIELEDLLQDF